MWASLWNELYFMFKYITQNFHFLRWFESLNTDANNTVDNRRKVVCVVGGGFGGLYTALNIGSRSDCYTDVYLISSTSNFAFSPLLYEMAMGSARPTEVAPLYVDLLTSTKVKFIKSYVEDVDIQSGTVKMNDQIGGESRVQKFDKLVLAVGIQPRMDLLLSSGTLDHVLPFYTVDNANKLKRELIRLKNEKIGEIKIVVIGGGCGGVEVAANVAENLGAKRSSVTIIDRNDKLMSSSADFNKRTAARTILDHGVTIRHNAIVKSVTDDLVVLTDRITGEECNLRADLVIVTAGTEQTPFVRTLDLQKDQHGKVKTRKTLQSVDYDHIYALGDCAVVEGASYPATAQVAMQQSLTVAFNVVESVHHERRRNATSAPLRLHEFTFINLGEMLSLGSTAATMSSLGGYLNISGPLAALTRRVVYALRMPTLEQTVVALCSAVSVTVGKLFESGTAL